MVAVLFYFIAASDRRQAFTFLDRTVYATSAHPQCSIRETNSGLGRNQRLQGLRKMHQDWQEIYRAAVLETDDDKLAGKIDLATAVLQEVLLELSSLPGHSSEQQRITDALQTLDIIRRIELQNSA
jgi:hypothetical protein